MGYSNNTRWRISLRAFFAVDDAVYVISVLALTWTMRFSRRDLRFSGSKLQHALANKILGPTV